LKRNPFEEPQPHPEFTVTTVEPLEPIRHEYDRPEPLEKAAVEFGDPATPERPSLEFGQPSQLTTPEPYATGEAPELAQVEPAPSKDATSDLEPLARPEVKISPPDAVEPVKVETSTPEPLQPVQVETSTPELLQPVQVETSTPEPLQPVQVRTSVPEPVAPLPGGYKMPEPVPPLSGDYKMPDPLPYLKPIEFGQDQVDVEALLADLKPRKEVRFLRMSGTVTTLSEEGY
jgi:hypothetical protein